MSSCTNYQLMFVENIRSLSHILLLQTDNFSNLQIKEFSRDTLERFQKNMCNTYATKVKVAPSVKAVFREYIEVLYYVFFQKAIYHNFVGFDTLDCT